MSCSLVKWVIIASVLTRPRRAAAKSGPDLGVIELAVSEDAHAPLANSRAVTAAVRIGLDLLIIAPQVRRPRRRAASSGASTCSVNWRPRRNRRVADTPGSWC